MDDSSDSCDETIEAVSIKTDAKDDKKKDEKKKSEDKKKSEEKKKSAVERYITYDGRFSSFGDYRILGKKGEGTFSEVLKCQNVNDGTYWACKKMKQQYDSTEQVNNLREIQAMRRLNPHPNILSLQEVIYDRKTRTLVLVCELMDMNIYELIRGKRHYLPENKVKRYMYQLLKSVEHMHRNGIFHRDVKPENILIKEDVLKLADFGSCRSVYSKQPYTEYISTRWYRAPECLLTDGYYTYKMDMWSVGCVFFEILSLHPLFPGSNEVDQIAKIHDIMGTPEPTVLNKINSHKARGMNFNFPHKKGTGIEKMLPHVTPEAIELIYQMCTYDPDERLSAKHSLKHPYFKDLRDADRRQAMMERSRRKEEEKEKEREKNKAEVAKIIPPPPSEVSTALEVDTTRSDKKKTEKENHFIPSLPKAQPLLPSNTHPHMFKSTTKRKKPKRHFLDSNQFSNHTGLNLPKVPLHANSVNSTFHTSSFTGYNPHNTSRTTMSLLPSINTTYKPHKQTKKTSNFLNSYNFPTIDRRGAGF